LKKTLSRFVTIYILKIFLHYNTILTLQIVEFFHRAIEISSEVKAKTSKLKDYKEFLDKDEGIKVKMATLKKEVNQFATQFPMPGFEDH
jgi:glycine hydroxymethyltransferase